MLQTLAGREGHLRVRRLAEIDPVGAGPLEVIAKDLVQLHELGPVRLQPCGKAFMQVRANRLGQRLVRGVADQQVAKLEAVLAGKYRSMGSGSAPDGPARPARCHRTYLVPENLDRTAVEDLSFDRPPLEDAALASLELVEAGRE